MSDTSAHIAWQDQPDGRGTFDILKSCVATIFLTCWTNVCPNVPPLKRRFGNTVGRLQLFLLSILGPDFVLSLAAGQAYRAWEDRKAFREQKYPQDWTLRACFFVNMGGLNVEFPRADATGQQSMPINCTQLRYLVDNDYLDISRVNITGADIEARNKVDGIGRAIGAAQALWFVVNTMGRVAQGLHITTMELTTLAFVFLMVISSFVWWRKPMDVSYPIFVKCDTELDTIIENARVRYNLQGSQFGRTPLSFLDRKKWFMSQIWESYMQLLRRVFHIQPRPVRQYSFSSLDFIETSIKWDVGFGVWIPIYSAIFMASWNNYFPTDTEQLLWRISSVICLVYGIIGCTIAFIDHNSDALRQWFRKVFRLAFKEKEQQKRAKVPRWLARLRNLSPDNDPQWGMSLSVWIPTTLLCIMYLFYRAFILFEDSFALRLQPRSTYQTVDWNQYSPLF